jgi:hypothetical protein
MMQMSGDDDGPMAMETDDPEQITINAHSSAYGGNNAHPSVQQLFAAATSIPMQHPSQQQLLQAAAPNRPVRPVAHSYQPATKLLASSNCSWACSSGYQSDLSPRNPLHHQQAVPTNGHGGNSL